MELNLDHRVFSLLAAHSFSSSFFSLFPFCLPLSLLPWIASSSLFFCLLHFFLHSLFSPWLSFPIPYPYFRHDVYPMSYFVKASLMESSGQGLFTMNIAMDIKRGLPIKNESDMFQSITSVQGLSLVRYNSHRCFFQEPQANFSFRGKYIYNLPLEIYTS